MHIYKYHSPTFFRHSCDHHQLVSNARIWKKQISWRGAKLDRKVHYEHKTKKHW